MFDISKIEIKDKVEIINNLFNQANSEIIRYRDLEWKITAWIVAIQIGVISSLSIIEINKYCNQSLAKLLYFLFIVIVCGYGIWHIHYIHNKLTEERNVRKNLEHLLGFYEKCIYTKSTLLPVKWGDGETPYWSGVRHLLSFWLLIIIVSIFAIIVVFTV